MKLISKSGHYRVVLRHGMPAEPLTGRNAVPGLYVLFKDGVAVVNDEEMIELIKKHPKFGSEFVLADDEGMDPYSMTRANLEPEHKIINIKHGSVESAINARPKLNLPPERLAEIDELVAERATRMAGMIAKKMVKEILVEMNKSKKGKPGRPGRPKLTQESLEKLDEEINEVLAEENNPIENIDSSDEQKPKE